MVVSAIDGYGAFLTGRRYYLSIGGSAQTPDEPLVASD